MIATMEGELAKLKDARDRLKAQMAAMPRQLQLLEIAYLQTEGGLTVARKLADDGEADPNRSMNPDEFRDYMGWKKSQGKDATFDGDVLSGKVETLPPESPGAGAGISITGENG